MRAHSRVRWLPALLVISLALPACKTPAPQPTTDFGVDPRIKRFDCNADPELCIGLGARATKGDSVLLEPEEGLELLEIMCESNEALACAVMATHFSTEIMLHEDGQPLESVSRLNREELDVQIDELNDKVLSLLRGSCDVDQPEKCGWLLDANLRRFYRSDAKTLPGEDQALIALFAKGEKLCLAGKEDRFQLCSIVSTWFRLTSENYPDDKRRKRVDKHLENFARPPCPSPSKRYSPEGCYGNPKREALALAACKAGDELGCADLVDAHHETIEFKTTSVTQMSRIVALSMDLDALPAKYSQLTEEQREQGSSILEFYYKSREERDALLPGWREAHRVGCVEGKVEEICASWKKACEEAKSSKECQGIP